MKKIVLLIGLILCLAATARGQSNDNPAVEIFGGPSILHNGATASSYSLYGGWQAQASIAREEDNRFAQGLQQHALEHIDKAHHHVEEAIDVIRNR